MKDFALILVASLILSIPASVYGEETQANTTPVQAEENASPLKTLMEKVSYAIGLDLGRNFKIQEVEINLDLLVQGFKDANNDNEPLISDDDIRKAMISFREEMIGKQKAKMKEMADKNKAEGETFLAENKMKEGVITLPSGLQYKIIKEGTGEKPTLEDTVVTHYVGKLLDGTEFDSSYKRGQPATFPVKGVITGWTEAIQLMKVGAQWQLFIPSDLAYGKNGAGSKIGPNSTLIFEVELIEIKPKETPETQAVEEETAANVTEKK